ncbi:putative disease resistance protein RGA3 isoform X1 [Humulus lupulus]|uniref:putative disease resistance protein RGA3 isoform X1 n=1 Tax=Humulus lupulus TaxID=3486 RepID=UPI002B411415|nr:putative disease resistance protein RGA3 isoform X1 [Humulus lupulus]XP_062109182.1 putative disease resistance protein RGA3 isoform X1 [Humulus lupulus]
MMVDEKLERPKTTSLVDVSEVYGRENEKRDLINKLLCESNPIEGGAPNVVIPIIPLVGMGGIGKTTLAQLVYNDESVKAHFEHRIWVCVSDPFDEFRIAKAIVEALEGKSPKIFELENLLQHIYNVSIKDKKFLLVLDDVWTKDDSKWEQITKHLRSGAIGSRILVTTRKQEVAIMMGAETQIINLTLLSENDCWFIFSQIAFSTRDRIEELEEIGKQIACKCKGLPLVAKTLGSLMRFKKNNKEGWEGVLYNKLWELEDIKLKVFVPFLLSYYDLPSIEKRCFSICSIFPKDYVIHVDDLIDLWMSQGYVTNDFKINLKKEGQYHFENLAMRSFFQDFEKDPYGNIKSCKMHDIIHSFSQFLTKKECLGIEVRGDDTRRMEITNENKIRHSMLVVQSSNESEAQIPFSIYTQKNLRTLSVTCSHVISNPILMVDLFSSLTCLRALNVCHCSIPEIPKEVDKLIHLRYLNVSENPRITELPDTLCNLCNLQTLKVTGCQIKKLPKEMGNLVNLRHLYIWSPIVMLNGLPKSLGRLTSLETLDQFVVPNQEDNSPFMKLEALSEFKHLQGSISIANCGRLYGEEARKAPFKDKEHLVELELSFTQSRTNNENESFVLESLTPHPNLKYLQISHYHGTIVSLNWLTSLTNLKHLRLFMCPCFESFPPLGTLPSLESLQMEWMQSVVKVGLEFLGIERNNSGALYMVSSSNRSSSFVSFPKLKTLHILSLYNWREWENIGSILMEGEEQDIHLKIMPCLTFLEISECYRLAALPDFLQNRPNLTVKLWPEGNDRLLFQTIMGWI